MKPFMEDSLRDTGRAVLGGAEQGSLEACFFSCPTPPDQQSPWRQLWKPPELYSLQTSDLIQLRHFTGE